MQDNLRANCPTNSTDFKEAACINVSRVYDSCCDRDCLEDMTVCFSPSDTSLISSAQTIRLRSAEIVNVNIDVEPVNFHRGYYTCNMTFHFLVTVDLTHPTALTATTVSGLAAQNKQVILFGSEGSVKTFSNLYTVEDTPDTQIASLMSTPRCTVQVSEPVGLAAELTTLRFPPTVYPFPQSVLSRVGGNVVIPQIGDNAALVTLGVFSIVQLLCDVQMLVPAYDFSFPEKKCIDTSDSPCDVFRTISFPTEDFFPPRPCDLSSNCACPKTGE